MKNFSLNIQSIPDIFPSGDYKAFFQLTVGNEILANVTVFSSAVTSNKDTFG